MLVLDALNFCFWGEPRWRVEYDGRVLDGYWALAACLRRALEAGVPLLDPSYLASVDEAAARALFAGEAEIPLLADRIANLREVGRGLLDAGGSFAAVVRQAGGSGEALVGEVIRRFPSFDDVATYDGAPVRLYKRAQILVSDVHGIYAGRGVGSFSDLDRLTAFADYKIPQVLREAGILVYSASLTDTVDQQTLIPSGDPARSRSAPPPSGAASCCARPSSGSALARRSAPSRSTGCSGATPRAARSAARTNAPGRCSTDPSSPGPTAWRPPCRRGPSRRPGRQRAADP